MAKAAWFALNKARHPGVSVKAEFKSGRVTITGLRIERPEGLSVDDLRSIPLPAIEASLNEDGVIGRLVEQRIRLKGEDVPEPPSPPTPKQMRLDVPARGKYPDVFYVNVAALYRALVANGVRPAPALAEANGVPVTTVHRWIKEARARRVLAPARKGGATG